MCISAEVGRRPEASDLRAIVQERGVRGTSLHARESADVYLRGKCPIGLAKPGRSSHLEHTPST